MTDNLLPQDLSLLPQGAMDEFKNAFTYAFGGAVTELADRTKMQNVAIFVDYDNVHIGFKDIYLADPDTTEEPDKNLFLRLWDRYGRDSIRQFRAYADFEKLKSNLTSLQEKRVQIRHVYSKSTGNRKNSSDIELCIDAIEATFKDPTITCYVIVTGDRDMIPLLSRLMYKGKRVELYYIKERSSDSLVGYAHEAYDLGEFLGLEKIEFKVDEFARPALEYIRKWYERNGHKADVWLGIQGTRGLKASLSDELKISQQNSSDLLSYLVSKELIKMAFKQTATKGSKECVELTSTGLSFLMETSHAEAAVSSEE